LEKKENMSMVGDVILLQMLDKDLHNLILFFNHWLCSHLIHNPFNVKKLTPMFLVNLLNGVAKFLSVNMMLKSLLEMLKEKLVIQFKLMELMSLMELSWQKINSILNLLQSKLLPDLSLFLLLVILLPTLLTVPLSGVEWVQLKLFKIKLLPN
jgi:hypothetical protein